MIQRKMDQVYVQVIGNNHLVTERRVIFFLILNKQNDL